MTYRPACLAAACALLLVGGCIRTSPNGTPGSYSLMGNDPGPPLRTSYPVPAKYVEVERPTDVRPSATPGTITVGPASTAGYEPITPSR